MRVVQWSGLLECFGVGGVWILGRPVGVHGWDGMKDGCGVVWGGGAGVTAWWRGGRGVRLRDVVS